MKRVLGVVMALMLMGLMASGAEAATFTMQQWEFNNNGFLSDSGFATPFDFGSVSASTTIITPGVHSFIMYVDPEIDQELNTFFNEYGSVFGAPLAGQVWEIDEPGNVFGDIYANFTAGALDNSNGVPSTAPDDVAMALGWNFILAAGEKAFLNFNLSEVAPSTPFYLMMTDPESEATLYLSSTLTIREDGNGNPVPEPSTFVLLGSSLAGLLWYVRKRKLS